MATQLNKEDGFYALLQTQQQQGVPTEIELKLMRNILATSPAEKASFSVMPFLVFGILSGLYVLLTVVSAYYFPNLSHVQDIKMLLLLTCFIYCIYTINEAMPSVLHHLIHYFKWQHA
jgi:hypothetical protein